VYLRRVKDKIGTTHFANILKQKKRVFSSSSTWERCFWILLTKHYTFQADSFTHSRRILFMRFLGRRFLSNAKYVTSVLCPTVAHPLIHNQSQSILSFIKEYWAITKLKSHFPCNRFDSESFYNIVRLISSWLTR
jgi:hypothetical protein